MPNISEKVAKNEAVGQKFGHRKKKISVYAQTREEQEKKTEIMGSRGRKISICPITKNLEELPNISENHRTI